MNTINEKRAFKKGLREVDAMPGCLGKKVREELMRGLNLRSRQSFCYRSNGYTSHTPIEERGIERIFSEYGCIDPWGE